MGVSEQLTDTSDTAVQVTQTYSPVTARSDHSLLQYGFVEEFEEPLLAAADSATGFEMEDDTWYGRSHLLLISLQLPRALAQYRTVKPAAHYTLAEACLGPTLL